MEQIRNHLYRCDDRGAAEIVGANGNDKYDLSGMNVELTIDNGWSSFSDENYKHPAIQVKFYCAETIASIQYLSLSACICCAA